MPTSFNKTGRHHGQELGKFRIIRSRTGTSARVDGIKLDLPEKAILPKGRHYPVYGITAGPELEPGIVPEERIAHATGVDGFTIHANKDGSYTFYGLFEKSDEDIARFCDQHRAAGDETDLQFVRFSNDFHNTEAWARPYTDEAGRRILSGRQVKRLREKLCGAAGCDCNGEVGERGAGNPQIEPLDLDRHGRRVQLI